MGTGLHANQPTGEIHIPYNFSYANEAARTGATGFVTADLGKFARQTDNNSIWMLVSTTPTWVQIGGGGGSQEPRIVISCIKKTAGTITKGQIVHLEGFDGSYPQIELAKADASATMPALGFAYETITEAAPGKVLIVGLLDGVDTDAFAVDDPLYVSEATAGAVKNTRPTGATSLIQKMGEVLASNATTGQIMVTGAGRTNDLPNLSSSKTWVGNSDGIPVEQVAFGSVQQDAESLGESENSTDTWEQKLRISMPATTPAGRYRIGVFYNWRHEALTEDFEGRVQVDDGASIYEHLQEVKDVGADQKHVASGFMYVVLTAESHTIDLDYRTTNDGDSAFISNARLEVWRVS